MEDSAEKCESQNGETLPPPYKEALEEGTLTVPSYPGGVQGSGNDTPPYSGGMAEVQSISVVHTQRVVRVNNEPHPPIESYLTCSIFLLLFCLPLGIVALVFSVQSRSRKAVGDFEGARQASSRAKFWSYTGFITGLPILIGVILWLIIASQAVQNL